MVLTSCGGGAPPVSPSENSFLNETWNGTLTVSRAGQPDLVGPATWTFELVPQTGCQNFNTTIRSQNMWISVTTTSTIVLTPTADPSGQIGGTGHYNSPRGCTGDFVTTGNAHRQHHRCDFVASIAVTAAARLPFTGRIQVTK